MFLTRDVLCLCVHVCCLAGLASSQLVPKIKYTLLSFCELNFIMPILITMYYFILTNVCLFPFIVNFLHVCDICLGI